MTPFYIHQKIQKATYRLARHSIQLPAPKLWGEFLSVILFVYLLNHIVGLAFVQGRLL